MTERLDFVRNFETFPFSHGEHAGITCFAVTRRGEEYTPLAQMEPVLLPDLLGVDHPVHLTVHEIAAATAFLRERYNSPMLTATFEADGALTVSLSASPIAASGMPAPTPDEVIEKVYPLAARAEDDLHPLGDGPAPLGAALREHLDSLVHLDPETASLPLADARVDRLSDAGLKAWRRDETIPTTEQATALALRFGWEPLIAAARRVLLPGEVLRGVVLAEESQARDHEATGLTSLDRIAAMGALLAWIQAQVPVSARHLAGSVG